MKRHLDASRPRRIAAWVLAGACAWYLAVILLWAVRGMTDRVSVGIDYSVANPQAAVVAVECRSPISSFARSDGPLPPLASQPAGRPPLRYEHAPCAQTHRDARLLLILDSALFALLGIVTLRSFQQGSVRAPRIPVVQRPAHDVG